MQDDGILVIVSGPSGAGKSTIISKLFEIREDVRFSVSATTRAPREGEVDGVNYFFKSRDEFQKMIQEDAFLEHAEYVGNYYGTPVAPVDTNLKAGFSVLLDIEVQGAAQVMEKRPEAVSIFLCPPSLEELERRLRGRGTDSEEKIRDRLKTAAREYKQIPKYNYIIINDDIDTAVRELDAIITAEKCRTYRKKEQLIMEGE